MLIYPRVKIMNKFKASINTNRLSRLTGLFSLVLLLLITASCGQWKVTTYKPDLYASLKNGRGAGEVMINFDDYGLEKLTATVGIFNGDIFTADNELKRVQVIEPDGDVDLVIGNIKNIDKTRVVTSRFNFSIIGSFVIDRNDTIYIQNRLQRSYQGGRSRAGDEVDFSPSYILVFNKDGELQYTLGQAGTPDIPFYHIESLDIDSRGRLFVISRSYDAWSIFRFSGKERDFFVNLGKLTFEDNDGDKTYKGKIDNVKIYKSGEKLLISTAFYHGLRLKYLKIYDYSVENQDIERTIIKIPDPKNVLFNVVNDRHIYFWNISDGDVRFIISNMEGDIINNINLKMETKKYFYSKILGNKSGDIYSYHVHKNGVDILEWK